MQSTNEVIATEPATQIAVYKPIEAGILEFLAKHQNVVHDVTTTKGMDAARRDRAECRQLRVKLEEARVQEKAESLAYGRKVDAEATRIRGIVEPVEDRYDAQIKGEEARKEAEKAEKARLEAERINTLRQRVNAIAQAPLAAVGKTSDQIAELLDKLRDVDIDDSFEEFRADAAAAHAGSLAQLELSRQAAVAQEAEQARIAAERAELARLRQADEARRRDDARKRVEEEQRIAAERKAEEDRIRAERAIEDERRKQQEAQERAEREEQDRARRAEIAAEEDRARAGREAEQKRLADERATFEAEQRAVAEAAQREREATAERQRIADEKNAAIVREQKAEADRIADSQRAESERIAAERAAFAAEQKRAASLLKARRGTAAIALSDILGITRNVNGYKDAEARAEIALIAEATLYAPKQKQSAAA